MGNHVRQKQNDGVKGWWNSTRNEKKWDKDYDDVKIHARTYFKPRQKVVLKFVDEIDLGRSLFFLVSLLF